MNPELPEFLRRRLEAAREQMANLPPGALEAIEQQLANMPPKMRELLERQMAALGGQAMPVGNLGAVGQVASGAGRERFHQYRGDIKAAVGIGGTLAFVTAHPEGQPTALYRLDVDRLTLSDEKLPCGGVALAVDGGTTYVGGTDRRVYEQTGKKAPKPLRTEPFAGPIAALVPLGKKRLAVLNGKQIDVVSDSDGSVLQTMELPEDGTCLVTDRTQSWLVAGTAKGTVAVLDGENKDEFEPGEFGKLHDGAVTALLFEPEELRFFSAGADNKLLSTFARGRLEPEDKGRGNTHDDLLTAMVWVPGDRFVSGGRDAALKTWPRVGGVKPATLKEGCGKVAALATVTVYNQPHVAACCDDNSIRLFKLEPDGRFADTEVEENRGPRVYGAADWVKNELAQAHDPRRRERALKTLAEWKDAASIDILGEQITKDPDHQLRLQAAKLLAASDSPRVGKILEKAISHPDGKVRVEAFDGLHKRAREDYGPIDLALKAGHADVGVEAVQALQPLAKTDDQGLTRLTDALNAPAWDVRKQALASLETVFEKKSPRASLIALNSTHGDVRAAALIRAYERGLLADPAVQSALRRRLEDDDTGVRKVAFLLSVVSHPQLAGVLRAGDPDLNRQVNELEKAEKPDKPAPEVPANAKDKLKPADYDVLLQATASRALDTCLRGARGLAVLRDPRAFGLLLQLSREDDANARVEVCRALAALDDARAVNRLRSLLFDREPSVRDAAYTALAKIFDKEPLQVAEAGLTAADEDVRRRGLETLIQAVRKAKPKAAGEPGWDLLVRALNDGAAGVRSEAFKAALNLKIAGGGADTLRFTLQSIHADTRREALTEATAQEKEEWATPLLYEFFNDPDPGLRAEAFAFATRKAKEVPIYETALASRHPDVRKLAVEGLVKKHSKAAQQVLLRALADPNREVRVLAVDALVDDDAKGPLREAMASPRPDIRVRAAAAPAKHGDAATLPVLRELAAAPEPEHKERVADWLDFAGRAFYGLAELGHPDAQADAIRALDSPHPGIRKAAAAALAWCSRAETAAPLRAALSHADPEVRYRAALGLAYLGDATVLPLVQTGGPNGTLRDEAFAAVLALGRLAGTALTVYLDHPDEPVRQRALLALLLLELKDTDGAPEKCLECLSAKAPRIRLTGAQALEAFADPAAFRDLVVKIVNDRGEDNAWKVTPEVVDDLATLLAFAVPQIKAATALHLAHFAAKEQAGWNQAWAVHSARFAEHVTAARAAAAAAGVPVPSKLSAEQLRELAFGGYVGLVREQGTGGTGSSVIKVRQTALTRLFTIASASEAYNRAAQPVLAQAMGDPNQAVRGQAFEHLQALGMDRTRLGSEALEAGFTDLGVKGLELLTDGTSSKAGEEVLERVMLTRTDDLAIEAAKLFRERQGKVPTASKALDAVHEPLRLQAVEWLAAEYEASSDAQMFLRAALDWRYRRVREKAAFELAGKKDVAAFDALAKMLHDPAFTARQRQIVDAFSTIGDRRAAAVFLDRVENDPAGTADLGTLIKAASDYRDPAVADRILALAEVRKFLQQLCYLSVLIISGHDQPVIDPEDENPAEWPQREKQHPRHDGVLARLMDRAFAAGDTDFVLRLIPAATWARGTEVDAVLAVLVTSPNAEVRNAAVQAAGSRLRKRNGPADPLLKALRHKNPETQFYAAEGLARGKRPEGASVLLSSIEYLEDVALRQRAVAALGELGDTRAVDKLLSLAGEDGHALQEAAAEAIGHLKRSPQADKVFRTLERLAKGTGGVAQKALVGLRWYDTPAGWDIVRAKAAGNTRNWYANQIKRVAVEQLGYNDDPATRDLLLKILRTERNDDLVAAAFASAVRLFGRESLEPHYQIVQNPGGAELLDGADGLGEVLKTVAEKGDALRLMEVFPKCRAEVQAPLEAALLTRPTLPAKEAAAALAHADEGTVRLASRLLGRLPDAGAAVRKAVGDALGRWWKAWQDRRAKATAADLAADSDMEDEGYYDDDDDFDADPDARPQGSPLKRASEVVESLLFTAARVGVPAASLADVAKARPDDPLARGIRLEAVRCLALGKPTPAVHDALESLAVGTDADVRVLAAELLARFDPKRAAALAEKALGDRPAFNRLVGAGAVPAAKVEGVAAQVHYQPVVLPVLVAAKDIPPLAAVAKDRKAPEAARLGAIEGLGVMADEAAEKVLVEVGTAKDDDKDVRKAAWRALRRSKRARRYSQPRRGGSQ